MADKTFSVMVNKDGVLDYPSNFITANNLVQFGIDEENGSVSLPSLSLGTVMSSPAGTLHVYNAYDSCSITGGEIRLYAGVDGDADETKLTASNSNFAGGAFIVDGFIGISGSFIDTTISTTPEEGHIATTGAIKKYVDNKVGSGGSGGSTPSNMVTTDTEQTITGDKTFTGAVNINSQDFLSVRTSDNISIYGTEVTLTNVDGSYFSAIGNEANVSASGDIFITSGNSGNTGTSIILNSTDNITLAADEQVIIGTSKANKNTSIKINGTIDTTSKAIATTIGTSETSAKLPTEGAIVKALKNVSGGTTGTPSNMVTTDTEQTITGDKTFTGAVNINSSSPVVIESATGTNIYGAKGLSLSDSYSNSIGLNSTTGISITGNNYVDIHNTTSTGNIDGKLILEDGLAKLSSTASYFSANMTDATIWAGEQVFITAENTEIGAINMSAPSYIDLKSNEVVIGKDDNSSIRLKGSIDTTYSTAITTTIGTSETSAKLPTEGAIVKALKNVSGGSTPDLSEYLKKSGDTSLSLGIHGTQQGSIKIFSDSEFAGSPTTLDYSGLSVSVPDEGSADYTGHGIYINNVSGDLSIDNYRGFSGDTVDTTIPSTPEDGHIATTAAIKTYVDNKVGSGGSAPDLSNYLKKSGDKSLVLGEFASEEDNGEIIVYQWDMSESSPSTTTITGDKVNIAYSDGPASNLKAGILELFNGNDFTITIDSDKGFSGLIVDTTIPETPVAGHIATTGAIKTYIDNNVTGGSAPDNMVTTDTNQYIYGNKHFYGSIEFGEFIDGEGEVIFNDKIVANSGIRADNQLHISSGNGGPVFNGTGAVSFEIPQYLRVFDTVTKKWTNTYKYTYLAQDANGNVTLTISDTDPTPL